MGPNIPPHYISITFAPLHFKCNYICHNLSGFTAWPTPSSRMMRIFHKYALCLCLTILCAMKTSWHLAWKRFPHYWAFCYWKSPVTILRTKGQYYLDVFFVGNLNNTSNKQSVVGKMRRINAPVTLLQWGDRNSDLWFCCSCAGEPNQTLKQLKLSVVTMQSWYHHNSQLFKTYASNSTWIINRIPQSAFLHMHGHNNWHIWTLWHGMLYKTGVPSQWLCNVEFDVFFVLSLVKLFNSVSIISDTMTLIWRYCYAL